MNILPQEQSELEIETQTGHKSRWSMYFWIVQGPHQKKMRKGKACGQVGHAAARLARMMTTKEWEEYTDYEVKIVYKVGSPDDLQRLDHQYSFARSDAY